MASKAAEKMTVDGLEFKVDRAYADSWEMFEIVRAFNDESISAFDKLDLSFEIIENATGVTKEQIIEHVGGKTAPAADVINFAVKIVQAITPKN